MNRCFKLRRSYRRSAWVIQKLLCCNVTRYILNVTGHMYNVIGIVFTSERRCRGTCPQCFSFHKVLNPRSNLCLSFFDRRLVAFNDTRAMQSIVRQKGLLDSTDTNRWPDYCGIVKCRNVRAMMNRKLRKLTFKRW